MKYSKQCYSKGWGKPSLSLRELLRYMIRPGSTVNPFRNKNLFIILIGRRKSGQKAE